ncbi:MAG: polysaccharide deacetylase family protein [Fimbriimonadaceae bacterium]|nr:polysaccharide deacetylase family protein [Fimbriimonadaceae bacterium]
MQYVFHYDLENPDQCLKAAPVIADFHRERGVPATFFMLGRVLERRGADLRAIFGDDPLFDIQSHTYQHQMLRDNKMHGPGVDLTELRREITLGREWVERVFERPCIGIRSGCGFFEGFQGEAERLAIIADCGARYLSSDLRGPVDSIPAGLVQAYWYDLEGQPDLLELPGHGWHDNVLKAQGGHQWLCLPWPPVCDWGVPRRPPESPEEECAVQCAWIDQAVTVGLDFCSPVYHPHSIYRMSKDCRIVGLLMDALAERGLSCTTYTALYERYRADPTSVPGRDAWRWEDQTPTGALLRAGAS